MCNTIKQQIYKIITNHQVYHMVCFFLSIFCFFFHFDILPTEAGYPQADLLFSAVSRVWSMSRTQMFKFPTGLILTHFAH